MNKFMRSLVRPFVAYFFLSTVFAGLPDGAQVLQGSAQLQYTAGGLVIQQNTQGLAITWNSFIVPVGQYVQFNQPGSSAVALNMVLGNLATVIDGRLSANANVILVNPNGIMVGPQGRVDTGGAFIASTKELKDYVSFLNNLTSKLTFEGPSKATIVNFGKIQGRHVFLVAQGIENHGLIQALNGTVALAAGTQVEIQEVNVESGRPSTPIVHSLDNASIVNKGVIEASMIKLIAGGPQVSTVGNVDPKGWGYLTSKVENRGTIKAIASKRDEGKVQITASEVVQGKNAETNAVAKEGRSSVDISVSRDANISGLVTADNIKVSRETNPRSFSQETVTPIVSISITDAKFDGKEIFLSGFDTILLGDSVINASHIGVDYLSSAVVRNTVISAKETLSFNSMAGNLLADNMRVDSPSAMLSIKMGGGIKIAKSQLQVLSAEVEADDFSLEFSDVDVASQLVLDATHNVKLLSSQVFAESFAIRTGNMLLARPPPETHTIKSGRNTSIETVETGRTSILAASGVGVVDALDIIEVKGSILYAGTSLLLNADYISNTVNLLLREDWKRKKKNWFKDETVLLGQYFHESPSSVGTAGDLVINARELVNTGSLYGLSVTAVINGTLTNGFTDKKITTPLPTLGGSEIDLSQVDFLSAMNRLYGSKTTSANSGDAKLEGSLSDVLGAEFLDGKHIATGDVNLTSLIQNAVPQATGKQYLETDWTTPEQQMQGLIVNTSKFLADNPNIKAGKVLSSADRELVKDPIIWMELVGKDRLVPKLYLPSGSNTYTTGGYLEAAKLRIKADIVHNTGLMVLGEATLNVSQLINERRTAIENALVKIKSLSGSKYKSISYDNLQSPAIIDVQNSLVLNGSYDGLGGVVIAGGSITATGEHFIDRPAIDLDIRSTNASLLDQLAGANSYVQVQSASPGLVQSGGGISIQMDTIDVRGTQVHAGGDVVMIAQKDFTINPVLVENDADSVKFSLGGISSTMAHTETLIAAQIGSTDGSVLLSALSGSLKISAANIVAAGTITAEGSKDVQFDAQLTTNWSTHKESTISLGSIGQSYSKQSADLVHSTNLIAKNIYITAGNDVNGISPVVYAENVLYVTAGGNFTVTGLSERHSQNYGGWNYGASVKVNGVDVVSLFERPLPTIMEAMGFASGNKATSYGVIDQVTRSVVRAIDTFDTMVSVAEGLSKIADGEQPNLNIYAGLQFGSYKGAMNTSTVKTASFGSGEEITFDVKGNVLLGDGARVESKRITVNAGGDMFLTSANNSSTSASKSSGVSLGLNFGDSGVGINVGGSKSRSRSTASTHDGALVQAVELDINVGKDLVILGSQLRANRIRATVGQELRMESQLSQSSSSSKGYSGSITIGAASAGSIDYQRSQSRGALVDAWAEIIADTNVDLRVGALAHLSSATIISLNDSLSFEAQGLEVEDLTETAKLRTVEFGVSGGLSDMSAARGHFGYASNDFEARANTVIGNSAFDMSSLLVSTGVERTLANRSVVTRNEGRSFGAHVSGGLVKMSEERIEQGIEKMTKALNDLPRVANRVDDGIQKVFAFQAVPEPSVALKAPDSKQLQREAPIILREDVQAEPTATPLESQEEQKLVSTAENQRVSPVSEQVITGKNSKTTGTKGGTKSQNVGSYSFVEPTFEDMFYSSLGGQVDKRSTLGPWTETLLGIADDKKATGNWFQRNVGVAAIYAVAAVAEGWNDTVGSQEEINHRIANAEYVYVLGRTEGYNQVWSLYGGIVGGGLGDKTLQALNDPEAGNWNLAGSFIEDALFTASASGGAKATVEGSIKLGTKLGSDLTWLLSKTDNSIGRLVLEGGDHMLYQSVDEYGKFDYIGRTTDFKTRSSTHSREKNIDTVPIAGLSKLSLFEARSVEQVLIEKYGLSKNGGTLLNKINSISPNNPIYNDAIKVGVDILKDIKYPGF